MNSKVNFPYVDTRQCSFLLQIVGNNELTHKYPLLLQKLCKPTNELMDVSTCDWGSKAVSLPLTKLTKTPGTSPDIIQNNGVIVRKRFEIRMMIDFVSEKV